MNSSDYIKFLGTGGARVVVTNQFRASGGAWLDLGGTRLMLDPGPGSLVKCLTSKPKLSPSKLHGIILSHKHLDHSGDINIMIEAMTEGGFKKRGSVFAPEDAFSEDPVILKYIRDYPAKIEILKAGKTFTFNTLTFTTPLLHLHGKVETYGLIFKTNSYTISWIIDSRYFPPLLEAYHGDIVIINVTRVEPTTKFDHLCVADVKEIVKAIQPKLTILTHFGMTLLKAKPERVALELTQETGFLIKAAQDGMVLKIKEVLQ
jgi:phosphoribosyl 1,2-cyclic phosphodiesterase